MIFSGKEEAHFWSACSSELFEPYPPQLLIYPHTNDWARSSVRSKAHQLPTTYVLVYLKTNTPSQGCQILQIRIHHLEHEQAQNVKQHGNWISAAFTLPSSPCQPRQMFPGPVSIPIFSSTRAENLQNLRQRVECEIWLKATEAVCINAIKGISDCRDDPLWSF
jgi:hypothetical protein